ncbi:hypothetical protein [Streptomyces chartreusis]
MTQKRIKKQKPVRARETDERSDGDREDAERADGAARRARGVAAAASRFLRRTGG